LQYSRARWYDATIGRFISEDPIGLAGGINQYSYVKNNSMNRVDPSGLIDLGYGSPGGSSGPYSHLTPLNNPQVYNCDAKCRQDLETMKGTFNKTVADNTALGRRLPLSGEAGGWTNNAASSTFEIYNFFPRLLFGRGYLPEVEGCIWQAENLRDNLRTQNYNYKWRFEEGRDFYGAENVNPDDVPFLPHTWTKVVPDPVNDHRPSFRFDAWKNEWKPIQ
jgi:hypothetical protein